LALKKAIKHLMLGHQKYCVYSKNEQTPSCLKRCFDSKKEAKHYKKTACACYVQKRSQRRPFASGDDE
jgi:hypothetical protein